jgi:YHS domain-containing protein
MKKLLIAASVVSLFAATACNQKANTPNETQATKTGSKMAAVKLADLASTKDLFCGMPLSEGAIGDSTVYEGKMYGFCSTECKDSFLVNPKNYLVQK